MLQVMLLHTWPTDCARSCSVRKEASSFSAHRQEESCTTSSHPACNLEYTTSAFGSTATWTALKLGKTFQKQGRF